MSGELAAVPHFIGAARMYSTFSFFFEVFFATVFFGGLASSAESVVLET